MRQGRCSSTGLERGLAHLSPGVRPRTENPNRTPAPRKGGKGSSRCHSKPTASCSAAFWCHSTLSRPALFKRPVGQGLLLSTADRMRNAADHKYTGVHLSTKCCSLYACTSRSAVSRTLLSGSLCTSSMWTGALQRVQALSQALSTLKRVDSKSLQTVMVSHMQGNSVADRSGARTGFRHARTRRKRSGVQQQAHLSRTQSVAWLRTTSRLDVVGRRETRTQSSRRLQLTRESQQAIHAKAVATMNISAHLVLQPRASTGRAPAGHAASASKLRIRMFRFHCLFTNNPIAKMPSLTTQSLQMATTIHSR